MNPHRLLDRFDRIAEAPDAVARLRRFILDLAVRGKLVEQYPHDEPASELLKRIEAEKRRLVEAGEIREKPWLPAVADEETPFVIPNAWRWTRFANVADFSAGRTPSRNDHSLWNIGEHAWVSIADMEDGKVLTDTKETVSDKAREQVFGAKPQPTGTILMSFKLTIGKIARLGIPAFHNEAIISIRPFLGDLDAYLFKVLPMFARQGKTKGAMKGATLNRDSISKILLPLPPIAEQHRIVANVDELMALCNRLEAAQIKREQRRDRLVAASLRQLQDEESLTQRREGAKKEKEASKRNLCAFAPSREPIFLRDIPRLITRPEHIKSLRQTILNLAVRGRLVPQDPLDEPASELLKRILEERAELVRKRVIRRERPLDAIDPSVMPFQIPGTWLWSKIGDVVLFTQYGTSQKSNHADDGVPVITMGNIQNGLVLWGKEKKIPASSDDLPALYLQKFDILYNRTNSAELVGKTGIYLGDGDMRTFASYLIRLRSSETSGCPRYLNIAMNAPDFRETQIVPLIKKQTGQANVNGTALRNMVVPVPPLAEQHRIVAKVDELMAICDQLVAQLTTNQADSHRLLEAVLHEALAPTTDAELAA